MDGDIPICNISNTNTSKIILGNPYLSKLRGSRQHNKYGNICCTRCREIISIVTLTFIHTIIGVMLSDKKERSAGFSKPVQRCCEDYQLTRLKCFNNSQGRSALGDFIAHKQQKNDSIYFYNL